MEGVKGSAPHLLMAHVAVFFMAMAGVLAGHSGFSPWQSTFYRVFFGGVILVLFWAVMKRKEKLPWRIVFLTLVLGALLGFHWYAFFSSIQLLGVTLGSALIGSEPLIVAIFALLFLKEKISKKILTAMSISSLGFLLLILASNKGDAAILRGCLWSLGSFVIFGVLVVANRKLVGQHSPMQVTTLEMLGAIPVSWYFCQSELIPANWVQWAYALGLGILCTGLAYFLFNSSMKKLSAHYAGALLSLEVAYGAAAGWMLGDHLTATQVFASILIANILLIDLFLLTSLFFRKVV